MRSYSDLCKLLTFDDRFNYLKLEGVVGEATFGGRRYLNQEFYRSREWKLIRDYVIMRDLGCDLGVEGHDIFGRITIHHMNPVTEDDIRHERDSLIDPEFLITVSVDTHNAIHYGFAKEEPTIEDRKPNDTKLW